MKSNISLISVGFDGYSLEDTLKGLSKTKVKNVSLCSLDSLTKHVMPEAMSREEWEKTELLFKKYGLTFFGLEGHCNVSDPGNLEKLEKRMEFTSFMNGKYIDTNAGPKGGEFLFFDNLKKIIALAERLNLTFCLETHGDIIESGRSGIKIFKRINSTRIRMCYDPANVYFYSNGRINPVEDLKYALDYIDIIHFKGIYHNQDKSKWSFPQMKDSIIEFDSIFRVLKSYKYSKMIAIEIENMFKFEKGKGFFKDRSLQENEIIDAYNSEIEYIGDKLT